MPPVSRQKKKAQKKRAQGGHAARNSPAKKRTAKRLQKTPRGRKVGFSTRMRRRFTDWRVRLDESRRLVQAGLLSFLTIGAYLAWATGVFAWMGHKIDQQVEIALVATGFSIEQVHVEGRNKTEIEALKAALSIDAGSSILHYDTELARERIEDLDWVNEAQVIRFLPDTIHVVVVERSPIAIWQMKKQLYLIDRTGFVVGQAVDDQYLQLPLVVGEGAEKGAAQLIDILDQHPDLQAQVVAAVRVGQRRWNLRLKSGLDIRLPAEDTGAALERLIKYDSEFDLLSQAIVSIDMRLPDRIYLKLEDDQAAKLWAPGTET
jgi:cell division protein FtsQ